MCFKKLLSKLKLRKFDLLIVKALAPTLSFVVAVVSFAFIFLPTPSEWKQRLGLFAVILVSIVFILLFKWWLISRRNLLKLKIAGVNIVITTGNIWNEGGLKVIAFNEYFDTIVDDCIIAKKSLNGQYVQKKVIDLNDFDRRISEAATLRGRIIGENAKRISGKKTRYELGSVVVDGDYILTAFSRFDKYDCANLTIPEYIGCLINLWREINRVYAQKNVALPLLGDGITRFIDSRWERLPRQTLLWLILWTFIQAGCKFVARTNIKIVLTKESMADIDFVALEAMVGGMV